jgi:N6-adenosine-specific RNA methylase IME4
MLKAGRYKTLYMDPPWRLVGGKGARSFRHGAGANHKYDMMSQAELLALAADVRRVSAEACHLYMWSTNNFLPDALELVKAYGFKHVTMVTWGKTTGAAMGQYYRSNTEQCLFAVKGSLPYKLKDDVHAAQVKGLAREQGSTLLLTPRTGLRHSEKPAEMRDTIERVSYGPYLELFGRRVPRNWDAIGNELEDCE